MVRVQKDIFSYRTFNSDSFMRRAFAIWGHFIVAHLLIMGSIIILILLFALLFGAFSYIE